MSRYQPKFIEWLAVLGLPADTPLSELPKGWQVEFILWSMKR